MPKTETKPKISKAEKLARVASTAGRKIAGKYDVPVYSLAGEQTGTLALPEEMFGAKVNKTLLIQALRVYSNNLRGHFSNTKTRSEVAGSSRKIQTQKGTGHARHGGIRAPIYVGGGIALGPKSRKTILKLPEKMKKAALQSALSSKHQAGEVVAVEGLEKLTGKTKQLASWIAKTGKKDALLVAGEKNEKLWHAARNLPDMKTLAVRELNAFEVISAQTLVLTREAAEKLK